MFFTLTHFASAFREFNRISLPFHVCNVSFSVVHLAHPGAQQGAQQGARRGVQQGAPPLQSPPSTQPLLDTHLLLRGVPQDQSIR